MSVIRLIRYEITRPEGGRRRATYTVAVGRRQFVLTRPLGTALVRVRRIAGSEPRDAPSSS